MNTLTQSFLTLMCTSATLLAAVGDDRPVSPDPEVGCQLDKEEASYVKSFEGKYKIPMFKSPGKGFEGDWSEIAANKIPEWMIDAKFGMYTHWGLYSQAEFDGNTYIQHIYNPKDTKAISKTNKLTHYEYHRQKYGPAEEFGYTDLVKTFTCDKYDASEYVDLMMQAGAKFGGLGVVHHEGYLMWDSDVGRWNAGKTGPKRDLFGEFMKAAEAKDFKTCATFHHARSYDYALKSLRVKGKEDQLAAVQSNKNYDINQEEFKDFFFPADKYPVKQFAQEWHDKIIEVMDKYTPDMIWFDGVAIDKPNSPEHHVVDFLKYYYKKGKEQGKEVTICNKLPGSDKSGVTRFNFPEGVGIRCYENGRNMPPNNAGYWLWDRAISYPWSWVKDKNYNLTSEYHVRSLVDIVARGGIFFLSLTPKGNGEIPAGEKKICREIGEWLKVNGEAIYATRRWFIPAEGDVKKNAYQYIAKRKGFWYKYMKTSPEQIRFTRSKDGKDLFVMTLGWPQSGEIIVKNLKSNSEYFPAEITSVKMLGSHEEIQFTRTAEGLKIKFPSKKPCDFAYSFKIN